MPEIGKIYEANIIDTTMAGAGVARIDGAVVFADKCAAGDECILRITEAKKNYFLASCEQIVTPSRKRTVNRCPYYARCGGCSLRHVSYKYEGEIKEKTIREALEKADVHDYKLNHIVMPSDERYRNKATFHFSKCGEVGYYENGTHNIIPLADTPCAIVPSEFSDIARFCANIFGNDSPDSMTLRISTTGKIMIAFDGKRINKSFLSCVEKITDAFPSVCGIFSREKSSGDYIPIFGDKYIKNDVCGIKYIVSPNSFFQINYSGAEAIFSQIAKMAGKEPVYNIFDLFCGTGTIGIFLANQHPEAKVIGIEINEAAVENAKMNAALNLTENVSFKMGDASEYAKICGDDSPDLTVIDPPRAGCSKKTIGALLNVMPKRIIYVSCNPFTLARDIKKLEEGGYKLIEATPVNMFPRSEHVETVCLMHIRN